MLEFWNRTRQMPYKISGFFVSPSRTHGVIVNSEVPSNDLLMFLIWKEYLKSHLFVSFKWIKSVSWHLWIEPWNIQSFGVPTLYHIVTSTFRKVHLVVLYFYNILFLQAREVFLYKETISKHDKVKGALTVIHSMHDAWGVVKGALKSTFIPVRSNQHEATWARQPHMALPPRSSPNRSTRHP